MRERMTMAEIVAALRAKKDSPLEWLAAGKLESMAEDEAYRDQWSGDYDGIECPNCRRLRMVKCTNGKRRCEKCNWDPDTGEYSEFDDSR
jgi:hypothetical protein